MADTTALLTRAEAEQRDFVTLTRALTDDQWAAPSLCAKWTVRETVMHTAIHTHQTLRESVKANREAVRRRDEPSGTLVDSLAAPLYAKSPWELRLQAGELMIHQQDIRRPLGIARTPAVEAVTPVAVFFASRNFTVNSRTAAEGLRLEATDSVFAHGAGPLVRGSTVALTMTMAGRLAYCDDVEGPGTPILRRRAVSTG